MHGSDTNHMVDQIEREYAKLIQRGEARMARLQMLQQGGSNFLTLELEQEIERCQAIVESMKEGFTMVQDYRKTWTPERATVAESDSTRPDAVRPSMVSAIS